MYIFHFGDLIPFTSDILLSLRVTIALAAVSTMGSLLGSYALLYINVCGKAWARAVTTAYIQVTRNTPILIQLFMIFFGLPLIGIRVDAFTASIVALIFNNTAYMTEILRGGLVAIPPGQQEAARLLGLGRIRIFTNILAPQATRNTYSALTNQVVILLLNTSICSYVAVADLTATGMNIASNTYRMFEVYIVLSGIYVALTFVASGIFKLVERRAFSWRLL